MGTRLKSVVLLSAALGFLVGSAVSTLAAPAAPDPSACGLPGDTLVLAAFEAAPARAIWQRLPAMARSPELEESTAAAFVMVLGDVNAPAMVGGLGQAPPRQLASAVCVVLPDGPILYYNVSRQGFRAP